MTRKRFAITIDIDTHTTFKAMAAAAGIHPGDFLKNLVDSAEARLAAAYVTADIPKSILNDQQIMFLLFAADKHRWPIEKLNDALKDMGSDSKDDKWIV